MRPEEFREMRVKDSYIVKIIKDRLMNKHQNAKIAIYGPPGSGKSYIGLSIGLSVDPDFWLDHVKFDFIEFGDTVLNPNTPDGSVWMWDDAGLNMTPEEWESRGAKFLSFLFQGSRNMEGNGKQRNHVYIVTVPSKIFIIKRIRGMFDLILEASDVQGFAKPLIPFDSPLDDGRVWKRYPKVNKQKMKLVEFPMPPERLREEYEKARSKNNMEKMRMALEEAKKEREIKALREENQLMKLELQKKKIEAANKVISIKTKAAELRAKGVKQRNIATELGVSQSYISQVTSGGK